MNHLQRELEALSIMTNQPQQPEPTAQTVAVGLTAEEIKRLKEWVNIDREFVNEHEKDLERKGLIRIVRIDHRRHQNMLTDLGNRVLEALDATPATAQPAPDNGGGAVVVTGKTPDDEMIAKILHTPGVDPSDWANSLSGIYAAIRSNQQIGDGVNKIEDWTDGKLNDYSLTESMFKLLERAQKAEAELTAANAALAAARERLAGVEGERDAAVKQVDKLQKEMKMVDHMADVHEEQYKQEKDNATMLYKALVRNTPSEIYKPVIEGLFQSTNEYDKLMSEGSRWKEKHQRATWKIEELEAELAALRPQP